MNLKQALEMTAREVPQRNALILESRRITYQELDESANRIANTLIDLGVKKNDHVAILMSHSPDWGINYFGIIKTGGVAILLSPMLKAPEIASLLCDSDAKVLITERNFSRMLSVFLPGISRLKHVLEIDNNPYQSMIANASITSPDIAIDDEDTATIIYTSGVLGKQKGVVHTHASLTATPDIVSAGLRRVKEDVLSTRFLSFTFWD